MERVERFRELGCHIAVASRVTTSKALAGPSSPCGKLDPARNYPKFLP